MRDFPLNAEDLLHMRTEAFRESSHPIRWVVIRPWSFSVVSASHRRVRNAKASIVALQKLNSPASTLEPHMSQMEMVALDSLPSKHSYEMGVMKWGHC